MGSAALHRGNKCIREQLCADATKREFEFMDMLNSLAKYPDASNPPVPIKFAWDGRMWWAVAQKRGFSGYGYWYTSLHEAVRRWNVSITGYVRGEWIAQ